MAPMRCRSPTNFMRWQHKSVQFEAPQFLSWKIPSSDQQCDTTRGLAGHVDGAGRVERERAVELGGEQVGEAGRVVHHRVVKRVERVGDAAQRARPAWPRSTY